MDGSLGSGAFAQPPPLSSSGIGLIADGTAAGKEKNGRALECFGTSPLRFAAFLRSLGLNCRREGFSVAEEAPSSQTIDLLSQTYPSLVICVLHAVST